MKKFGDTRIKRAQRIICKEFYNLLDVDARVSCSDYYISNNENTVWGDYLLFSLRHRFDLMDNKSVILIPKVAYIAFHELNFEKVNQDIVKINKFAKIIEYIKSLGKNEIYRFVNSKDITFDKLYKEYFTIIQNQIDEIRLNNSKKEYDVNNEYDIIKINSFTEAKEYGAHTGIIQKDNNSTNGALCYTEAQNIWNNYTSNNINQCYICLNKKWKEIPCDKGENYPKDEYGNSMIFLFVDEMGYLTCSNTRWNHGDGTYGNVDQIYSETEISNIIGKNFEKTFLPNSQWKDLLTDINRRLKTDEHIKHIFDYVGEFVNGFAIVQKRNRFNFINENKELLNKEDNWYAQCNDFYLGLAFICISDKKESFISTTGEILSLEEGWDFISKSIEKKIENGTKLNEIFDQSYDFHDGYSVISICNNKFYNFIDEHNHILCKKQWFLSCHDFCEGYAVVLTIHKPSHNLLGRDGKLLINNTENLPCFYDLHIFHDGWAFVLLDNGINYINAKGEFLLKDKELPCKGDDFRYGFAYVSDHKDSYFIDTKGNIVLDSIAWNAMNKVIEERLLNQDLYSDIFDEITDCNENMIKVELHRKSNIISDKHELLYKSEWLDECCKFNFGMSRVRLGNTGHIHDKNQLNGNGDYFVVKGNTKYDPFKYVEDPYFYITHDGDVVDDKKGWCIVKDIILKNINNIDKYNCIVEEINGFKIISFFNKYNILDSNNNLLYKGDDWFDYCKVCNNELLFKVGINEKGFNLMDMEGNFLRKEEKWFEDLDDFQNGFALVRIQWNRWQFIKNDGTLLDTGNAYIDVSSSFENGFVIINDDKGNANFMDEKGNILWHGEEEFDRCSNFENALASVHTENKGYNILKTDGTLLWNSDTWFKNWPCFVNGFALIEIEGKGWNLIDTNGELLWKGEQWFDNVNDFCNGFAQVRIDRKGWNYLKADGTLLWDGEKWFDECKPFTNNMGFVRIENNDFNFLTSDGKFLWKDNKEFDEYLYFGYNVSMINEKSFIIYNIHQKDKGYNLINNKGEFVWKGDVWFNYIEPTMNDDYFQVFIKGKGFNIMNSKGELSWKKDKWLLNIFPFTKQYSIVQLEDKRWNFLSFDGKLELNNDYFINKMITTGLEKRRFASIYVDGLGWNYITENFEILYNGPKWFDNYAPLDNDSILIKIDNKEYMLDVNGKLKNIY